MDLETEIIEQYSSSNHLHDTILTKVKTSSRIVKQLLGDQKLIFKMAAMTDILDFWITPISAVFDVLVCSMLHTKFHQK